MSPAGRDLARGLIDVQRELVSKVGELSREVADLRAIVSDGIPQELPKWVDVKWVATHYSVSPKYVYAHAGELGGVRLTSARNSPIRFDREVVDLLIRGSTPPPAPTPQRKRAPARLLPVKGEK